MINSSKLCEDYVNGFNQNCGKQFSIRNSEFGIQNLELRMQNCEFCWSGAEVLFE